MHPQVLLNGVPIPLDKTPKIFDTKINFFYHIKDILICIHSHLQILKALAGTLGDNTKKRSSSLTSLILSIINYAAPVWVPNVSATSLKKLQVVYQNRYRMPFEIIHHAPVC
jgi:hypothetical protein